MSSWQWHPGKYNVYCCQIEFLSSEKTAGPVDERFVVSVGRVDNEFQEFLIPGYATHAIGRAATFSGKADRSFHAIAHWNDLFQSNLVSPIVNEVVQIDHRVAVGLEHLGKPRFPFVD